MGACDSELAAGAEPEGAGAAFKIASAVGRRRLAGWVAMTRTDGMSGWPGFGRQRTRFAFGTWRQQERGVTGGDS